MPQDAVCRSQGGPLAASLFHDSHPQTYTFTCCAAAGEVFSTHIQARYQHITYQLLLFPLLCLQYPLVVLMLINGEIYQLINFASFARWSFIALATLGMLIHRYRFPLHPRPFKVGIVAATLQVFISLYTNLSKLVLCNTLKVPVVIAVIFTVVCFFIVGLSLYSDPWNTGKSCVLTLTGVPVYYVTIYRFYLPNGLRRIFSKSYRDPPSC